MKITIKVDEAINELSVSIVCKQLTPEIEKLLASIRMLDHRLTGKRNGETYLLDINNIIYIESVDRKCFMYTSNQVYESEVPLYELEQQLTECGFLRVSKSFLIHMKKIQSLKSDINRRVLITMENGEKIIASRQYANELKNRLGVK